MKIALGAALAAAALTAAALTAGGVALADEPTGPDTDACKAAETALAAAVAKTVEYSADVYPGDVAPTVEQVTPELLALVLADEDLGGGARTEVEAAVAAFTDRDAKCAEPAAPPAVEDDQPAGPVPFPNCDAAKAAGVQPVPSTHPQFQPGLDADNDGVGCEVDDEVGEYTQVDEVPVGAVDTGDGSTA